MKAGRLRSRCRIRRAVESADTLGRTVVVWPVVGRAWLEVRAPKRLLARESAGERVQGSMEAEMRAGVRIQARDVLEIYAGPEAGTRWRAASPPHRPGRGELVIALEVFTGELPEPEGTE
jgi:head-tail adaptor